MSWMSVYGWLSQYMVGLRQDIKKTLCGQYPDKVLEVAALAEVAEIKASKKCKLEVPSTVESTVQPHLASSLLCSSDEQHLVESSASKNDQYCLKGSSFCKQKCLPANYPIANTQFFYTNSDDGAIDEDSDGDGGGNDQTKMDKSIGRPIVNVFTADCRIKRFRAKLLVDGAASENVVSQAIVDQLHLHTIVLTQPYYLLGDAYYLKVTHKCRVSFSIDSYNDRLWCAVANINVCDVLLGLPRQHYRKVKFSARKKIIQVCPQKSED